MGLIKIKSLLECVSPTLFPVKLVPANPAIGSRWTTPT